jgi:hypothetical protein
MDVKQIYTYFLLLYFASSCYCYWGLRHNSKWVDCSFLNDGQNNGYTKKLKNRICVGHIERTEVGNTECFFFCLFTLSSVGVSVLVMVLRDSPCDRIGKWETCPILEEDRSFLCV